MRKLGITAVIFLVTSLPVFGQGAEVAITAGWGKFTNNTIGRGDVGAGTEDFTVDDGVRIGTRLSMNTGLLIGHEFNYAWQKSDVKVADQSFGGISIHNLYYNFLLHATPEGSPVRPFVTGGAGVSVFNPPGVSSFSGAGDNKFGFNYGAGIKVRVTESYGFRLDVRDHVTGKPFDLPDNGGRLHNLEVSAGFSLLF
jgi:hypothetical protein